MSDMKLLDGKEPEADAIHIAGVIESLRACKDPQKRYAADVIERLSSAFSDATNRIAGLERLLSCAVYANDHHWLNPAQVCRRCGVSSYYHTSLAKGCPFSNVRFIEPGAPK